MGDLTLNWELTVGLRYFEPHLTVSCPVHVLTLSKRSYTKSNLTGEERVNVTSQKRVAHTCTQPTCFP